MATYLLKPHQLKAANKLLKLLRQKEIGYLAGEVRTGKTGTALYTASKYKRDAYVVFITSKKAISSIKKDFKAMKLSIELEIINYESLHKIQYMPDILILDEAHRLGKFPRPSKKSKQLRKWFTGIPTILMSGTPSPESFSQLFHQFWCTGLGPWKEFKNFYKWAHKKVNIKKVYVGMGLEKNDYSEVLPVVAKDFKQYAITMTQHDAGFDGKVVEKVHTVKAPKIIHSMLLSIKRTLLYDTPELMADTQGKLASYFHQLSSGTVIDVDGEGHCIDGFKLDYIKKTFKGKKKAIFYIFRAEGQMLKDTFPNWTDDPEEFNKSKDKVFVCQVKSGQEGTDISTADVLIFFNISYSAVSYWQARARTQTRKGGDRPIHWIFSDTGIEQAIYDVVNTKKDFTTKHFKNYVGSFQTKKNQSVVQKARLQSDKTALHGRSWYSRFASSKKRSG